MSGSVQCFEFSHVGASHGIATEIFWLMPAMVMTAPESVAAVESAATEKPEPRSVKAIGRADNDAEANWRNVYDRARRWRRVIVRPRGCAVRFNHIGAGVRAQSSSKPECEHRQYHDETFLSHDRIFLLLFRRFNPTMTAKLPGNAGND